MTIALPGWVVDDDASILNEMRDLVDTTPGERWQLARLCCRDALWAIRMSPVAERILAFQDPLPGSTVAALARLRRMMRQDVGS